MNRVELQLSFVRDRIKALRGTLLGLSPEDLLSVSEQITKLCDKERELTQVLHNVSIVNRKKKAAWNF